MTSPSKGPYLMTLSFGERPVTIDAFGQTMKSVVAMMLDAGEVREPFTPGDLRRTVETRLAAAGISGEIRAHLQSHGLHGVQHKHYNMHDYAAEKRMALETVLRLASGNAKTPAARTVRANSDPDSQRKAAAETLLAAKPKPKPSKRGVTAAQLKNVMEDDRR